MQKFKQRYLMLFATPYSIGMVGVIIVVAMMALSNITVMADAPALNLADVMETGISEVVGQVLRIAAVVLPIGLGLIGIIWAIRKGISIMRYLVSEGGGDPEAERAYFERDQRQARRDIFGD